MRDLKAADLRVFDNGVEQAIASFEKIGGVVKARNGVSIVGEDPQAKASIIILFDSLNTARGDQFISHDEIAKLFGRLPGTRFALLGMDEYLRVLQDFSSDREALRAAIHKYEWDYAFDAFTEAGDRPYPAMDMQTRIAKTVDALRQVARLAGNVRGKKNLLWLTSGFPVAMFRGEVMKAVHELVAANVALYPINPAGLLPGDADDIVELAALTGGHATYGSNNVTGMAEDAIKSTGEGYVMTFVPSGYSEDGSFHEIRVETSIPKVELHYRIGYIAGPSR
jgi:VWFA-related protein